VAVRSRRVTAITTVTANNTILDLYTVPSGRTLILRGLAIANGSGGASALARIYQYDDVGGNLQIVSVAAVAATSTYTETGWWVGNPGDKFSALLATSGVNMKVCLWGSLLDGAPE